MKPVVCLVLAAISAATPLMVLADGSASHGYSARQAKLTVLDQTRLALSVLSDGRPMPISLVRGRAQTGSPRAVVLDGVLTEMNEVDLRVRIASGALVIVYPGTSTRWLPDDSQAADYPPAWY
jgi:hypothetical protein